MKQIFNIDFAALQKRVALNNSSLYDLENWIKDIIVFKEGMRVLDIGCGNGKHIFAFEKLIAPSGSITGIDVSQTAINYVNKTVEKRGLGHVNSRVCDMEDVVSHFDENDFDIIISSYAIYYSKDQSKLLIALRSLLKENGQLFICGYGRDSNREIYELINGCNDKVTLEPVQDFITDSEIQVVANHYSNYEVHRLENKVIFKSPQSLMTWWKNHNSYEKKIEGAMERTINDQFGKKDEFLLSKNVLAVRYLN